MMPSRPHGAVVGAGEFRGSVGSGQVGAAADPTIRDPSVNTSSGASRRRCGRCSPVWCCGVWRRGDPGLHGQGLRGRSGAIAAAIDGLRRIRRRAGPRGTGRRSVGGSVGDQSPRPSGLVRGRPASNVSAALAVDPPRVGQAGRPPELKRDGAARGRAAQARSVRRAVMRSRTGRGVGRARRGRSLPVSAAKLVRDRRVRFGRPELRNLMGAISIRQPM